MNILITGGTGVVGLRLSLALAKDNRVFVFSRRKGSIKDVNYIEADLCSNEILDKDLGGIDVVYHLAANLDEQDSNMYDENIQMTKNIIDLCKRFSVKQLVLLSSSGVLGETKEPALEENSYNPKTIYEKSKMECEILVKESGLNYTIIRAPIIIAPNKIWQSIVGAAKKGFPIIGSGENMFHLSYIDDVVSLLALVKNNEKAYSQIFNAATKDAVRYIDVYRMICDELKQPMTTKHVSVFLIKFVLFFKNLVRKDPVINNASVDRLIRNRWLSIEKAKSIGFEPKFSTQHALKETIKYLKLLRLGYSQEQIAELSFVKK